MSATYEGNNPYIFISYSHKDSAVVLEIIDSLISNGYRVWYDDGIEAGSEWPDYIADHLDRCGCVLSFLSENFVESDNCRRELTYALDEKKPMLNVYIQDFALPKGIKMQIGLNQAIYLSKFSSMALFCDELCKTKMLEFCHKEGSFSAPASGSGSVASSIENDLAKELNKRPFTESSKEREKPKASPAAAPKSPVVPKPEVEVKKPEPVPPKKESASKSGKPSKEELSVYSGRRKFLGFLATVVLLSYLYFSPAFALEVTDYSGFWYVILNQIPTLAISIVNLILFKTLGKKLPGSVRTDMGVNRVLLAVPVMVVGTILIIGASSATPFFASIISGVVNYGVYFLFYCFSID